MTNFLQRFHFLDTPVRGEMCRISEAYQEVLAKHNYPAPIQRLLGQAMTAVALMAATLKLKGSLVLQIQGDGPMRVLMAEANERGDLRALARFDELAQYPDDWLALTGRGQLVLTIEPDEGERYQGIVPLEGESLAAALSYYFQQSEQLPTGFWLFADEQAAAGLLLQQMPGERGDDDDAWSRLTQLAVTLSEQEALTLDSQEILYRLYHDERVELFPEHTLRFHCGCTRERSAAALSALDPKDIRALLVEQGGQIRIDCQFCHQVYCFDAVDIDALFSGGGAATGVVH